MNKAQEALSELKRAKETLYPLVTMYDSTGLSDEAAMTLNDIIPTFEELVDRATPMKPNIVSEPFAYASYNCAKCNEPVLRSRAGERPRMMPKFCQYCGQEIDWTNESK